MTASVVLPVKALVMNMLTLTATLGLMVLAFQNGALSGLLGFQPQGAINLMTPLLAGALAFGLSTDYGVFLLSRIREGYRSGLPTREAVALGLQRVGRVVTSAAILFCIAVGALVLARTVILKEIGLAGGDRGAHRLERGARAPRALADGDPRPVELVGAAATRRPAPAVGFVPPGGGDRGGGAGERELTWDPDPAAAVATKRRLRQGRSQPPALDGGIMCAAVNPAPAATDRWIVRSDEWQCERQRSAAMVPRSASSASAAWA